MPEAHFDQACDRLSSVVDDVQFERLRWARNEGPKLARLEELAHGALASREEFELVQEGASADIKRFVLKVHSIRVVGVALWLDGSRAVVGAEPAARSKFTLASDTPISVDYALVDEDWMSAALQELFSRIQG